MIRHIAVASLCVALSLLGRPARAEEAIVAVQVNGQPISDGELVDIERDHLIVSADLARRLRLKGAEALADGRIDLAGIAGIHSRLDAASQTLRLTIDPGAIKQTVIGGFLRDRPFDRTDTAGLFGNYTALVQDGSGGALASALVHTGIFSPQGTFSTDIAASTANHFQRLQSHFGTELDDGDTVSLGDSFLTPGSFGQAFPFAGFSLTSRGRSDGGYATTPVQSILGEAALPSTVDVYVNDALQSRQSINPGPFAIQNLPTVTGQGEVRVVVRDVLGREEVITRSFFGSTELLQPDAENYGYQAGILRRAYGNSSFDYAEPFASATVQHGFTGWLTGEIHAEASDDRQMLGGRGSVALGDFGVFHIGGAASRFGRIGALLDAGFDGQIGPVTLGVSTDPSTRTFTELGYTGERSLRESSQAHAAVNLGTWGSVDVSLLRFHLADQPTSATAAAGYTAQMAEWLSVDLSVSDSLTGTHDVGGFLTLSLALGDGATASASTTQADHRIQSVAQANTAPPDLEGVSYSASAQHGAVNQTEAGARYRSTIGDFGAAVGTFAGAAEGRLTASGSIEVVDGRVFATRQENGAFAVVETGEPGIHVAVDQQPQGVTDGDGQIFLPHLRPGEINHVTIDPTDIPLDATLPPAEQEVIPRTETGYVVRFPIRHLRSATLTLVNADGSAMRPGTTARVRRTGARAIVGLDGFMFLDDIVDGDELEVATDHPCLITLRLPDGGPGRSKLAPKSCE